MINPKARPCEEAGIHAVRVVGCAASKKIWVLVATILASTIAFIDESVVNIAFPAIEKELGASLAVVQWIVNAYMLCLAALQLIGGAAGDRFGRRKIFIIGLSIFAAASVWCGFSGNIAQLIAARVIQGFGAALLIPCSLAIIGATFNKAERGKAIGTWAGFTSIAAAVGPLLGGWIVDQFSWRAIFLINPVLALPALWVAFRHLPESFDPRARAALDWRGGFLVLSGLAALVYGLIASPTLGWLNEIVIATLIGGTALLIAFVLAEQRIKAPMVPLELFRSRTFSGINLLTLFLYAALSGAFFFLPFSLIQVHGYSATLAGASFLPFTVTLGILSRWSGGLLDRFGARGPLIIGPVICAAGYILLAFANADSSYALAFFLPITVLGLGMAISVAPLTTAVINAVPLHKIGVASGINNSVASIAGLMAVAIFGSLALSHYNGRLDDRRAAHAQSPAIVQAIDRARTGFVIEPALGELRGSERDAARAAISQSMTEGIRLALELAAALALAAALCAAFTLQSGRRRVALRSKRPAVA